MNDFEKQLQKVKELLYNEPIVVEYMKLKQAVSESDELKQMNEKIVALQKEMTLNVHNPKYHAECKLEYEKLLNEYNTHPLVTNFRQAEQGVENLLNQIRDILK